MYKTLKAPSMTLLDLKSHELPLFHHTAMVFMVENFLGSWNSRATQKYQRGGKNNFKLVMVGRRQVSEDDYKSMEKLFAAMWLSGIVQCAVLLSNDTSSEIYTYIPYRNHTSCENTAPVRIGECSGNIPDVFDVKVKVGLHLKTAKELYCLIHLSGSLCLQIGNLNQCPLRIAITDVRPIFSFPLRGLLSPLIREITKRMNASVQLMSPRSGSGGGVCGRQERSGTRGMVVRVKRKSYNITVVWSVNVERTKRAS